MNSTVIYSFTVAFTFAFWPIVTRFGKVPAIWTALLVNAGTLVAVMIYYFYKDSSGTLTGKMVLFGIVAGILNGVGFLVYSYLLSNPAVPASTVVILIDIMIPIIAVVLGVLFLKETISAYKIAGFFLSLIGIYLIVKK